MGLPRVIGLPGAAELSGPQAPCFESACRFRFVGGDRGTGQDGPDVVVVESVDALCVVVPGSQLRASAGPWPGPWRRPLGTCGRRPRDLAGPPVPARPQSVRPCWACALSSSRSRTRRSSHDHAAPGVGRWPTARRRSAVSRPHDQVAAWEKSETSTGSKAREVPEPEDPPPGRGQITWDRTYMTWHQILRNCCMTLGNQCGYSPVNATVGLL